MREKRRALPSPLALLHTILILCLILSVHGIDHIHSDTFPEVHLRTTTIDTSTTPIHEGFQQGSGRRLLSKHHCHTHHHRWGPLQDVTQALFSHQHGLSHDQRHALVGHIESSGAKVVGSVPDNTLLVVGSGEALSQAANHTHLVWTGLFHPEHKIAPEWDAILHTVEEVHESWKRRGGFANATDAALQWLADDLPRIQAVPYHSLVSPSSLIVDEKIPPMLGIEVTFPQGWMAPPRPHAAGHHHALDVQTRAARILVESEKLHAGEAAKSDWEPLLREAFDTKYIVVKGGSKDTAVVFASAEHVSKVVEWLAERPSVHWVAPLPRLFIRNNQASSISQSGRSAPTTGNYNTNSDYHPFWSVGITGKDVIIGCGDSGIDRYHCNFVDPDVDFSDGLAIQDGYRTFSSETHRKIRYYKAFGDTIDHNGHGTHTANTLVGMPYGQGLDGPNAEYVGMAPDAKIAFLDLSNAAQGDVITAPYNLASDYFRLTWDVGARIHSDSWGSTSPTYTAQSAQVDAFCWTNQEFLPFFPSGNERGLAMNALGLETISSPATSKNCMTVGATLSVGDQPVRPASVVWTATADSSEGIDTEFAMVQALFGGSPLPFVGQPTKLVLAEPLLGCSALKGNVQGAFVLVFRGDCFFSDKAANAQNAGAAGIIIYDNEQRPYVQAQAAQDISGGSGGGSVTIPVLSTSRTDGQAMANEVLAGRSLTVTLDRASSLSNSFEDLASYSSQGPTMDGRIKPDILAPGTITSAAPGEPVSNSCSLSPLQLYSRMAGTSMATPAAAGSAALVRDYFLQGFYPTGSATPENKVTPSGALLKAVLLGGAQHLRGYDQVTGLPIEPSPSFRQGYGRLDLSKSLPLSTNGKSSKTNMKMVDMVDINTGESHQYCVRALGGPFTVTLVWHDYPSSVAAQKNLVNDLDLTVRAAGLNGIRMLGNGGDGLDSSQPDKQNNAEKVTMTTLPAGQVAIEVKATQTYAAVGPQPYSLVITGDFSGEIRAPEPGTSSSSGVCPVVVAIIKSGPSGATSKTPVFEIATQDGTGTGTGITFECKLTDMEGELSLQGTHDWRECGSKVEYANIADGQYQFTVRGMGEELTSSQTFVYDTTAPALQLASDTLPANPTTLGIANIEFSAADSTAVNYQCKLSLTDRSPLQRDVMYGRVGPGEFIELAQWYNCTSPQDLRWLLPGSWNFEVQATDGVGNNSEVKRYPWSIAFEDAVSYVRLLSGPFGKVAGGDQVFDFTVLQGSAAAPAAGETECRIGIIDTVNGGTVNFGEWTSCSSPAKYAIAKDDTYRFESRLKANINENTSTTAVSVIEVDATPPTLTVEERPSSSVLDNPTATFRFSLNEEGTAMCRLSPAGAADPSPLEACTSPMIYEGLADGGYVFTITGKDAVGNQAPSQDISFIVDSSPPVFTFISGPAAVNQGSVTVDWGVIDEGSGIQNVTCYFRPTLLANGQQGDMGLEDESVYNWQLCSPPATFTSGDGTGLQEGRYALTLRASDVGGLKTTTEDYVIFVDFTPPTVGLKKVPPTNKAVSSTLVLEFEDAAPGVAAGAGSNVTWNVFTTKQTEEEWMAIRNGTAALEGGSSGNAGIQVLSVDNTTTNNNNRKLLQNEGVDTSIDQSNSSITTPANQQQPPSSLAPNQLGKDNLDEWANCTSPCTIKGLRSGYYAMQVRGTDDAGNQGGSSPIILFNVDTSLDPDSGLPDWALYTIIGVSVAAGVIIIATIGRCVYVRKRNKRLGISGGNSRAQLNGPQGALTTSDFASYSFAPSSGYHGGSAFDTSTANGGGLNGSFTSPYASNPYGYMYTPPQVAPTVVGAGGGGAVDSQQMAYALAASQRGGGRVNGGGGGTDAEMRAAIQASLEEEQRRNRSGGVEVVGNDDEMLRAAIEASLREQQYQRNSGW